MFSKCFLVLLAHAIQNAMNFTSEDQHWHFQESSFQLIRFSPCDDGADLSWPFDLCVCHEEGSICKHKRLLWNIDNNEV